MPDDQRPLVSVLTATYNRSAQLSRLADSLRKQGLVNFEWIIVDDGSTDDTQALLRCLSSDSGLRIRHFRVENGGKHKALNRAIPFATGSWVFIVDSDDALPPCALERITRYIKRIEHEEKIGGVMGLRSDFSDRIIGKRFPASIGRMSATDVTFKAGIRGDKAEIYRTELLRRFPFPEFEGENFITECVVWYRIASAGYDLSLVNDVIYSCEYQRDGLSANSLRLRVENPNGTLQFYKEELSLHYPTRSLLREAANYDRFALLTMGCLKGFRSIVSLRKRALLLAIVALPIGVLATAFDRSRLKRCR